MLKGALMTPYSRLLVTLLQGVLRPFQGGWATARSLSSRKIDLISLRCLLAQQSDSGKRCPPAPCPAQKKTRHLGGSLWWSCCRSTRPCVPPPDHAVHETARSSLVLAAVCALVHRATWIADSRPRLPVSRWRGPVPRSAHRGRRTARQHPCAWDRSRRDPRPGAQPPVVRPIRPALHEWTAAPTAICTSRAAPRGSSPAPCAVPASVSTPNAPPSSCAMPSAASLS